jgi:hypothetical protein
MTFRFSAELARTGIRYTGLRNPRVPHRHTEELAAATLSCQLDSSLGYGVASVRAENYLPPTVTHEESSEQDGFETVNTISSSTGDRRSA